MSTLCGIVIVVVVVVAIDVFIVLMQVKQRRKLVDKKAACKGKIKLLVICCISVNLFTNSKRYSTEFTN